MLLVTASALALAACSEPAKPRAKSDFEPVRVVRPLGGVPGNWPSQGPSPNMNAQTENLRNLIGGPVVNEVSGAIRVVVAHPTDANTLYA